MTKFVSYKELIGFILTRIEYYNLLCDSLDNLITLDTKDIDPAIIDPIIAEGEKIIELLETAEFEFPGMDFACSASIAFTKLLLTSSNIQLSVELLYYIDIQFEKKCVYNCRLIDNYTDIIIANNNALVDFVSFVKSYNG